MRKVQIYNLLGFCVNWLKYNGNCYKCRKKSTIKTFKTFIKMLRTYIFWDTYRHNMQSRDGSLVIIWKHHHTDLIQWYNSTENKKNECFFFNKTCIHFVNVKIEITKAAFLWTLILRLLLIKYLCIHNPILFVSQS